MHEHANDNENEGVRDSRNEWTAGGQTSACRKCACLCMRTLACTSSKRQGCLHTCTRVHVLKLVQTDVHAHALAMHALMQVHLHTLTHAHCHERACACMHKGHACKPCTLAQRTSYGGSAPQQQHNTRAHMCVNVRICEPMLTIIDCQGQAVQGFPHDPPVLLSRLISVVGERARVRTVCWPRA